MSRSTPIRTANSRNTPATQRRTVAQILRIVFVSGRVAERRGDDETVAQLFDFDELGLIDYVMSIHLPGGEIAFFTEDGDQRFEGLDVLTLPVPMK